MKINMTQNKNTTILGRWTGLSDSAVNLAATAWGGPADKTLKHAILDKFGGPENSEAVMLADKADLFAAEIDTWLTQVADTTKAEAFMKTAAGIVQHDEGRTRSAAEAEAELKALCTSLSDAQLQCNASIDSIFKLQPGGKQFLVWLHAVLLFAKERDEAEVQYIHFLTLMAAALFVLSKLVLSSTEWREASIKDVVRTLAYEWKKIQTTAPFWLKLISTSKVSDIQAVIDSLVAAFGLNSSANTWLDTLGVADYKFSSILSLLMEKYGKDIEVALTNYHFNIAARKALQGFMPTFLPELNTLRSFVASKGYRLSLLTPVLDRLLGLFSRLYRVDSSILKGTFEGIRGETFEQSAKAAHASATSPHPEVAHIAPQAAPQAAPHAPHTAQAPIATQHQRNVLETWDRLVETNANLRQASPSLATAHEQQEDNILKSIAKKHPQDYRAELFARKESYLEKCSIGTHDPACTRLATKLRELDEAALPVFLRLRPPTSIEIDTQARLAAQCNSVEGKDMAHCAAVKALMKEFYAKLYANNVEDPKKVWEVWQARCQPGLLKGDEENLDCQALRARSRAAALSDTKPNPARLALLRSEAGIFCRKQPGWFWGSSKSSHDAVECELAEAGLLAEIKKMDEASLGALKSSLDLEKCKGAESVRDAACNDIASSTVAESLSHEKAWSDMWEVIKSNESASCSGAKNPPVLCEAWQRAAERWKNSTSEIEHIILQQVSHAKELPPIPDKGLQAAHTISRFAKEKATRQVLRASKKLPTRAAKSPPPAAAQATQAVALPQ